MKYYTLLFVSILITHKALTQNLLIKYEVLDHNKTPLNFELLISDSLTNWIEKASTSEVEVFGYMVKNRNRSTVFLKESVYNQEFDVIDSMHTMKWELLSETKQILGYQCNQAKTYFRGRNYIAYYCSEIPLSDGPWKFGGLPGLILEVNSMDNIYKFTAIGIEKTLTRVEFDKIVQNKFIVWDEFVLKFKQAIDNWIKSARSSSTIDNSGRINVKFDGIEIIYPKVQTGNGFTF